MRQTSDNTALQHLQRWKRLGRVANARNVIGNATAGDKIYSSKRLSLYLWRILFGMSSEREEHLIMKPEVLLALLDSIVDPIVFVDDQHIIRYINPAASEKYGKRGTPDLVGNSIFIFHNEKSNEIILEMFESFRNGEEERFLVVNQTNQKVFMRAVRDKHGSLIGYYERYETA
jgi:PAS domain S-box-containing protein